jgi:hypothetical protein
LDGELQERRLDSLFFPMPPWLPGRRRTEGDNDAPRCQAPRTRARAATLLPLCPAPPCQVHLLPPATKAGQRKIEQSKDSEEEEAADDINLIQRRGGHRRHRQLPPEKPGRATTQP